LRENKTTWPKGGNHKARIQIKREKPWYGFDLEPTERRERWCRGEERWQGMIIDRSDLWVGRADLE